MDRHISKCNGKKILFSGSNKSGKRQLQSEHFQAHLVMCVCVSLLCLVVVAFCVFVYECASENERKKNRTSWTLFFSFFFPFSSHSLFLKFTVHFTSFFHFFTFSFFNTSSLFLTLLFFFFLFSFTFFPPYFYFFIII